jgi:hypothetical protein
MLPSILAESLVFHPNTTLDEGAANNVHSVTYSLVAGASHYREGVVCAGQTRFPGSTAAADDTIKGLVELPAACFENQKTVGLDAVEPGNERGSMNSAIRKCQV